MTVASCSGKYRTVKLWNAATRQAAQDTYKTHIFIPVAFSPNS